MPTLARTIDATALVVRSGPRDAELTYRLTAEGERFLTLVLGLREGMEFANSDLEWLIDKGWAVVDPRVESASRDLTGEASARSTTGSPAAGAIAPRAKAHKYAGGRGEPQRSSLTRRTRGREVALQVLYQIEQNPGVDRAQLDRFLVRRLSDDRLITFTRALIDGVLANQPALDAMISELAENWRIDRMAAIDRNILRLGAFELLHCADVPRSVAINEALELAKRYSTAQSSRFVNGILDRVQAGGSSAAAAPPVADEVISAARSDQELSEGREESEGA
jgi:N utilization substance protein B